MFFDEPVPVETFKEWNLHEHIAIHKPHKQHECVCCCILFSAVFLDSLDVPVGEPASETTLAMTGVASSVSEGPGEKTKHRGDIAERLHSISMKRSGLEPQKHARLRTSPCVATLSQQNCSRQVRSQKCLTSPSMARFCFSFPLRLQVSHFAT